MDNPTIRNTAISAGAGLGTYYLVKNASFVIRKKIFNSITINTPNNRIEPLQKAADAIMKNEGLEQAGVKIVNAASSEYRKRAIDDSNKYLFALKRKIVSTKNPVKKIILLRRHKLKKQLHELNLKSLIDGTNGFYIHRADNKNITLNTEKGIHIFFHEAGHAIDFTKPFLAKLFKRNKDKRLLRFPIFVVLGSALLTPSKKELPNGTKNRFDKVNTFVKDHSAILSALGFIPMLACETSANIKGQLLGMKYAPKDMKLITKTHLHSMAAYWSIPLVAIASVGAAKKAHDFIAQKLKSNAPKI